MSHCPSLAWGGCRGREGSGSARLEPLGLTLPDCAFMAREGKVRWHKREKCFCGKSGTSGAEALLGLTSTHRSVGSAAPPKTIGYKTWRQRGDTRDSTRTHCALRFVTAARGHKTKSTVCPSRIPGIPALLSRFYSLWFWVGRGLLFQRCDECSSDLVELQPLRYLIFHEKHFSLLCHLTSPSRAIKAQSGRVRPRGSSRADPGPLAAPATSPHASEGQWDICSGRFSTLPWNSPGLAPSRWSVHHQAFMAGTDTIQRSRRR